MAAQPEPVEARLDALRRGLYRRGATDEDVRRFADLRDAIRAEVGPDDVVTGPAPRRRPRPALLVGGAVVAAGALTTGLLLTAGPGRTPVAGRTAVLEQTVTQGGWRVSIDGPGGIPAEPATEAAVPVDGRPVSGQVWHGRGADLVPIDTSSAPTDAGRVVVVLTPSGRAATGWQAVRPGSDDAEAGDEAVIATGTQPGGSSTVTPSSIEYRGTPPSRIRVFAGAAVRWTLTVAFLREPASAPR